MSNTITITTEGRALISMDADMMSLPASGQADERWGMPQCPSWHNSIRYYRDVMGYAALEAVCTNTCPSCDGAGTVPFKQDRNKPAYAQRRKPCPSHVATAEHVLDVASVPQLDKQASAA